MALQARADHAAKKQAEKAAAGRTYTPPVDPPDDLDGVLALRNLVAHPTVLARQQVPSGAWVEAWRTVAEWLDLALLARLGHRGRYFPRRQDHRWQGFYGLIPVEGVVEA